MADVKAQANQFGDDKEKKYSDLEYTNGIEFIQGNPNILLIAPHGVESDPLDDIGTAKLTKQISAHLGCTAIINPTFRKPEGSQPDKRNDGEPSFKEKVLNLNLLDQVKQHPLFRELIKAVVNKEGLTYVFWIHGIDKNHIDSGIGCYLGYGQPNTKDKEESRYTAEKETIDKTINQLSKSGIRTILAPENSGFRGWKETYMNQWLKLEGYDFTQAQSIQLEFRNAGIRGKKDIQAASKKIAMAISTLIEQDKPKATPNVDKSSVETKTPADAPPEEITDPAETEGTIDENGPASSQPTGENTATEAGIESATEEKIPEQDTALTQKMTEADGRENAIDVGEKASKSPEDENALVKVRTEVAVVEEDPIVEEAYNHLKEIFVEHISMAMLESGQYLIQQFYDNDYDKAKEHPFNKNKSLNQLFEKLQTESSGNVPKKKLVIQLN